MLIRENLFQKIDLEAIAIERLKEFEPSEGYYFANSGGKDSGVVRHLLIKSGVKFNAHYNWTTVDPPELLRHIKDNHPETAIHRPKITMWELIPKKLMPPTRLVRYCCESLKEGGGVGRMVVTGVRWAESYKRSKRKMVETCFKDYSKQYLNLIIEWTDEEVWNYTRQEGIKYCSLYDEGFKRLGCIGCPMAGVHRLTEFERYPKIRQAYLSAFGRMLKVRAERGKPTKWKTPEEVMEWWLGEQQKENTDQSIMFE